MDNHAKPYALHKLAPPAKSSSLFKGQSLGMQPFSFFYYIKYGRQKSLSLLFKPVNHYIYNEFYPS